MVVPSRGRPDNIARLMAAMAETCRGDTTLVVGLDSDDPKLKQYPGMVQHLPDLIPDGYVVPGCGEPAATWEYELRSRLRHVVPWMNALVMSRLDSFRYVGTMGDDNVPLTAGWDVAMMAALQRTPFAFGNDLYKRTPGTLPCHIFTRSEVVRALGYLGFPQLQHMWVDVAWLRWGQECGITYKHDVIIDHVHYSTGRAPLDATYMASDQCMRSDQAVYAAYCEPGGGLDEDIKKIKSAVEESK